MNKSIYIYTLTQIYKQMKYNHIYIHTYIFMYLGVELLSEKQKQRKTYTFTCGDMET